MKMREMEKNFKPGGKGFSNIKEAQFGYFRRMKTVFGHAIMAEGSGAGIYNILYDKSG